MIWQQWPTILFGAAIVALAALVVFLPALKNEFVWDDKTNFMANQYYRGLGWVQLKWMFTTFHMGHYQPLSWISLGLDYLLWGMKPLGYHFTNLVFHSANVFFFYLLAFRLLRLAVWRSIPIVDTIGYVLAAAVAALIFGVHPLRVESVVWITERRDVLSGFFFMLTVLYYLKAVEPGRERRHYWLAASVILYFMSLASKPIGVSIPVVLLILDFYPLHRLPDQTGRWFSPDTRRVWLEKIPFVLLALITAVIAVIAQQHAGALMPLETRNISARLAQASFSVIFYLWRTVVPFNLSPFYGFPPDFGLGDLRVIASCLALSITSVLLISTRRKYPAGLALWCFYLIVLLPVLGIVQAGPQLAADRYTYLPSLAPAMLIGAVWLFGWINWPNCRILLSAIFLTIFAGYGELSWQQTKLWRNAETLWAHALRLDPDSYLAHTNMGIVVSEKGKQEEAIQHFQRSIKVNPSYGKAYSNLANMLAAQGQLNQAVELYWQTLELEPTNAIAHYNLGNALYKLKRHNEAAYHYAKSVELKPDYIDAYNNLACVLDNLGRLDEAIRIYVRILEINPRMALVHNNMGSTLVAQGKHEAAINHYRQALDIQPDLVTAHNNWGNVLLRQGKIKEAISHYEQVVQLDPNHLNGQKNLKRARSRLRH